MSLSKVQRGILRGVLKLLRRELNLPRSGIGFFRQLHLRQLHLRRSAPAVITAVLILPLVSVLVLNGETLAESARSAGAKKRQAKPYGEEQLVEKKSAAKNSANRQAAVKPAGKQSAALAKGAKANSKPAKQNLKLAKSKSSRAERVNVARRGTAKKSAKQSSTYAKALPAKPTIHAVKLVQAVMPNQDKPENNEATETELAESESVEQESAAVALDAHKSEKALGLTSRSAKEPLEQPAAPLKFAAAGYPFISDPSALSFVDESRSYAVDQAGNKIYFTLKPELQLKARSLLQRYDLPWGAIVALDPRSGRVLALASYSAAEPASQDVATRATFPAASLFKLVTASAAVERLGMVGDDVIRYRGGDYTLERFNYAPDLSRDRKSISFAEALGRSVNPAFARVALNKLSARDLQQYAENYGFDYQIPFDLPLEKSRFTLPEDDYEIARTAAGFGDVKLSPLHAAVIAGTIGNKGVMMRPFVIDHVESSTGQLKYRSREVALKNSVQPSTAREVLDMMVATVDTGTARKQFIRVKNPLLKSLNVAGKTGTLKGDNPKGLYHWFVAAVPAERPEIAICTLVIDPGGVARVKSSALARELLEKYYEPRVISTETRSSQKKSDDNPA